MFKLYNVNSIVFFFLLLILSSFFSDKSYAVGVIRLKNDDNPLDVFYLGSRMGGNNRSFIQVTRTGGGCFWYGVKDSNAPDKVAYNLRTKRFNSNYSAISPIPSFGDIAEQVARGGFCSKIILCNKEGGDYKENTIGEPDSFEYFAIDNRYSEIGASRNIGGDGPVTNFYRRGTEDTRQNADPNDKTYDVVQCNLTRKEKSGGTWVTKNGIFETCEEAVNNAHGGLNSSMVCAKFMCNSSNNQVLNDWDNIMNNGRFYSRGKTERDTYSCPWLAAQESRSLSCKFYNPEIQRFYTSCIYDNNGQSEGDCWNETPGNPIGRRTIDTNEIGLGGFPNKRIFCGIDNKPVICPNSVTDYPNVFEREGSSVIKNGSGCVLLSSELEDIIGEPIEVDPLLPNEPVRQFCVLSANVNCIFGDLNSENNCFDQEVTNQYTSPDGDRLNLFCDKRGRTISCESQVTNYAGAFPGTIDRNGDFIPRQDLCSEFDPGMEEIPERPAMECELNEEGQIFGVRINNSRFLFNLATFRQCVSQESRNGNPQGANAVCIERQTGQGGLIKQCTCDVTFNPNYDFWRCNILPNESDCSPMCILQPAENAEPQVLRVQPEVNPMAVIKSISDFLFALAVLIFIINLLRASFMYVTSGGDEGKMKEAQSTITNTIFGMVFIVFIGALLRWVIGVAQRIVQ